MITQLLDANESLTAVLAGAPATTQPVFSVVWYGEGGPQNPVGSLTGATAKTLLAGDTHPRDVSSVQIVNLDTANVTVTIKKVVDGTGYTLLTKTLEPNNVLVWSEEGISVTSTGASESGVGTAATDVTAVETQGAVRKTVLTLDGVSLTVANTTGVSFGGTKVYDFPAGRILVLGALIQDVTIGLTDAGNVTPIDGTMGGDLSVGSTAPDDGTLTETDVDLIPSTSIDPISGGITGAALAASAQFDGTTTALDAYLNMLIDDADVEDEASDVLLVSGTLTIWWINLGDY